MHAARSRELRRSPACGRSRPGGPAHDEPSPGRVRAAPRRYRTELALGRLEQVGQSLPGMSPMRRKRNGFRCWWSGARDSARTSMRISLGWSRCQQVPGRPRAPRQSRCSSLSPSAFGLGNPTSRTDTGRVARPPASGESREPIPHRVCLRWSRWGRSAGCHDSCRIPTTPVQGRHGGGSGI